MRPWRYLVAGIVVLGPLVLAGCTGTSTDQPKKPTAVAADAVAADGENEEILAALAKLDPEDRKLAQAQRWCAVQNDNVLGGMGVPYKVMVEGRPVFLCCDHCKKRALADPAKTLATVDRLKAKAAEAKTP